ncbi:MAG TPA: polysaccharide deacetylase [Mobilitalea sp.]|nr:polysaccharide deacetylase [Mobilitalea sp.]
MTENKHHHKKKSKKIFAIVLVELLIIALLIGAYRLYILWQDNQDQIKEVIHIDGNELTQEQKAAQDEQDRLKKEMQECQDLIAKADQMTLGYDYDGAIELLKSYKGAEGGYEVYTPLANEVDRLEKEKEALPLYGGVYNSVYEINHLFFHTLIADTSLAFDGDYDSKGYNKYMTTISEFEKLLQSLYDQGYVLIRMSDIAKKVTLDDGTTKYVPNEFYLREGKKPIIISEDDVAYYDYMKGDGFASRIVIGDDGKPTCEMALKDGKTTTGPFDVVPILDDFVKKHPDFSYKGAKGLLTLTGYEGILGYRTNDTTSPAYEADVEAVKKVVEVLKTDGWDFGCHSWGHKDMQTESLDLLKWDTNRWLKEVGPLVGPTDIYVFPFGYDIETTSGTYSSDKYKFLKESGFDIFLGVYKEPWMHIKKDYVRMTRRPVDGQAMLEFPDRLKDLFNVDDIKDPRRPAKNW